MKNLRSLILLGMIANPFMHGCTHWFMENQKPALVRKKLEALEASSGGRIGLSVVNAANEMPIQFRAYERFPFCSTVKTVIVGAILKKSEVDHQLLQERVLYKEADIKESGYAPITAKYLNSGMTIAELSAATLQYSDNAAANLLIRKLGGPAAITAFAKSQGDNKFRLDRWEPELNSAIPSDPRDTSTPAAMAKILQSLTLGNALGSAQREMLIDWLKGNTTGDARIRAGVPNEWIIGDKTGTCDYGTTNDIGIVWPINGSPSIVAIYYTQNEKDAASRSEVIASAMRILVDSHVFQ